MCELSSLYSAARFALCPRCLLIFSCLSRRSKTSPIIVKIGGVGILAVSLLWFSKIMRIASGVVFGKPDKSKKKA